MSLEFTSAISQHAFVFQVLCDVFRVFCVNSH